MKNIILKFYRSWVYFKIKLINFKIAFSVVQYFNSQINNSECSYDEMNKVINHCISSLEENLFINEKEKEE